MAPNDASGASKNKNQIYFYKNTGTDRKPIFTLIQKNFLQESTIDFGGGTAPSFADIDKDGDDDLFLANHGEFTSTLNWKLTINSIKKEERPSWHSMLSVALAFH